MLQVFSRNYVDNLTTDVFDVDNWQKSYEQDILESRNDIVGALPVAAGSKEQVLMLHSQLIQQTGGCDGVRDYTLLDSELDTSTSKLNIFGRNGVVK